VYSSEDDSLGNLHFGNCISNGTTHNVDELSPLVIRIAYFLLLSCAQGIPIFQTNCLHSFWKLKMTNKENGNDKIIVVCDNYHD
jgi:hypothetical protein